LNGADRGGAGNAEGNPLVNSPPALASVASAGSVVRVVSTRVELEERARALAKLPRLGIDVESDGMFAYRAQVCTVQLVLGESVVIVDALATALDPLAGVLGERGPIKIVHDVAFDARMLAAAGVPLGNVHDTSIAARLLGRTATGLASLCRAELGVEIDKGLQHHDWRERPLQSSHLAYLARDVAFLEALADALWRELRAHEIEAEVLEETRYRIKNATLAAREPESPTAYASAKGFERLDPLARAVFRHLWSAREGLAAQLDTPAARTIATEALLALARGRPRTVDALAKARVARERFDAAAPMLLAAIANGIDDGDLPPEDRATLDAPRPSREENARRRGREGALTAWRKAEAKRRGVDEQVVLPGHCLKALAEAETMEVGSIQAVPGFGECRARYVEEIAAALRSTRSTQGPATESA
jgi:ribonuclease D